MVNEIDLVDFTLIRVDHRYSLHVPMRKGETFSLQQKSKVWVPSHLVIAQNQRVSISATFNTNPIKRNCKFLSRFLWACRQIKLVFRIACKYFALNLLFFRGDTGLFKLVHHPLNEQPSQPLVSIAHPSVNGRVSCARGFNVHLLPRLPRKGSYAL